MSPRTHKSRHTMPASGPYSVPRSQFLPTRNASYPPSAMLDNLGEYQHYSLSPGPSPRSRHEERMMWDSSNPNIFPDQDSFMALPPAVPGPYTIHPVEVLYSQAMMSGFEAQVPLDTSTDLFNPLDVTPIGRHQAFPEQDLVQDSMLPMETSDFESCMTDATVPPFYRHTTMRYGLPSPSGSDCMLSTSSMSSGRSDRHGISICDDVEIQRELSPYELPESDAFSRHKYDILASRCPNVMLMVSSSDARYPNVQPRPIRSASERKDDSHHETYQGDALRSREYNHEKKKPRSSELYEARPGMDGLYRCPYSHTQDCNHKPTKQKCIYDKNLDSHLKPYKCTEKNCEESSFSSNACLFRHQREAHGLHGHSAHLCRWSNCERAQPGNGFPRKWNLGDHMKRVHGYEETKDGSGDDSFKKRRVTSSSVPMARSTSSKSKVRATSPSPFRVERHSSNARGSIQRSAYPPCPTYTGSSMAFPYQIPASTNPYENMMYDPLSRHVQPLVGY